MQKIHQKDKHYIPRAIWHNPWYFIAFGFGSGAIPIAPGTFGTLLAIPFYLIMRQLNLIFYCLMLILFTIFAIILSDYISKKIKIHDHPGINLDEFIGFFVTMIAAPHTWSCLIMGFILFRLFDISKPPPINWVDRHIKGGFGMVLDDIIAGILAFFILKILVYTGFIT